MLQPAEKAFHSDGKLRTCPGVNEGRVIDVEKKKRADPTVLHNEQFPGKNDDEART